MIVAAGLTPAWQQILTFAGFHSGEVNRATSSHWIASGKVLNVGSALHHLEAESHTITVFGGETGRMMRQEFDSLGVPTAWVETTAPTRVCTTILDQVTGSTTELVENSTAVTNAELQLFEQQFAAIAQTTDWTVLSGSLPRGTPPDFYRRCVAATSGRVLLDARGPELLACLPLQPFLVKPNREELGHTFGRILKTDADLLAAMRELRNLGAQRVVVSHGEAELWLLNDSGLFRFRPPNVPTVNPIGCGDCLAAGLAVAFAEGADDIRAVKFGMAAAADNARQLLSSRLRRSEVERLAHHITVLPETG